MKLRFKLLYVFSIIFMVHQTMESSRHPHCHRGFCFRQVSGGGMQMMRQGGRGHWGAFMNQLATLQSSYQKIRQQVGLAPIADADMKREPAAARVRQGNPEQMIQARTQLNSLLEQPSLTDAQIKDAQKQIADFAKLEPRRRPLPSDYAEVLNARLKMQKHAPIAPSTTTAAGAGGMPRPSAPAAGAGGARSMLAKIAAPGKEAVGKSLASRLAALRAQGQAWLKSVDELNAEIQEYDEKFGTSGLRQELEAILKLIIDGEQGELREMHASEPGSGAYSDAPGSASGR